MSENKLFRAYVNPLIFFEADEQWASHLPGKVLDFESVVRFICAPEISSDLESLTNRYREISGGAKNLSVAPAEPNILEKLVWPLRNAKACYMVGNYLGTISLCGMVAEMVAILIFEISNISINGKPMDKLTQESIFGRTFENLGQDQRVRVLHAMVEGIDTEVKSWFDVVRTKRKRYLHFFSQEHTQIIQDAREVFDAAVKIVLKVIGQNAKDGVILLNPDLIKYLEQKGVMETREQAEPRETE
jgi:hypothetical protein